MGRFAGMEMNLGSAPNLDCTKLKVPVNWGHLDGPKISLGMTGYKAASPEKRLGSIIYNPGGPREVGPVSSIAQALVIQSYSLKIVEYYDVIRLDPRGIGLSTPIKCDPDLYNKQVFIFPTDEAAFQEMVSANKTFAESCRDRTGALFFHVDTASAAHDLEAVRIALKDDKLNWIGLSYGTMLGAAYAELYPENVGRMLPDELPKIFDELVVNANKSPIPAIGCTGNASACRLTVNGEDILSSVQGNGYLAFADVMHDVSNTGCPTLAQVLNAAVADDATGLSSAFATSETDGSYPSIAIGCLDWYHNATTFSDTAFIGWPAVVKKPNHALNRTAMKIAPPILMVNSYHDPEASYVWAEGLQAQIPSGVLLSRNGSGHISYHLMGEATVVIDAYLVNGTLPLPNIVVNS
ncbi:hypothetical protein OIDMADRAFT_46180 [Oidiodendron maius Zn]|uniref:AB hydrolase-1 domain-containing protein n=1 Tax=Oidiodendron maius (strain Zn) TaxID=913774 RepID=A0A0C3GSW7_OIDMZ|nr:hypothetical protein OIDMADRAFT_46180 [Oidiodendron maius Zn]